ncbi:MAG TPA: DNA translocase FtsK 4TM domain-containing protein, partial [Candidatus Bathyarchaeia archaeon]|nr:DNA translocase FtsK 4TM domain-containing protein [Candidatus Bathyarchaeia archaeon]
MKKEYINEIQGVVIFAAGLLLLASLISFVPEDLSWYASTPNIPAQNLVRIVGAYVAGVMLFILGYSAYFLAAFLLFWSWNKFSDRDIDFTFSKLLSSVILFCSVSTLFSMIGSQIPGLRFQRAGLIGFASADFLIKYLGWTGSYIVLFALAALTLIVTGEFLVSPFLFKLVELFQELLGNLKTRIVESRERAAARRAASAKKIVDKTPKRVPMAVVKKKEEPVKNTLKQIEKDEEDEDEEADSPERDDAGEYAVEDRQTTGGKPAKPNIRIANTKEARVKEVEPKIRGEYHFPSLDLLDDPPEESMTSVQSDLESGAAVLETTLKDFSVNVRVADVERGPVITRYELEPAPGVKVNRITALADDIALAMKVAAVRIVAPIPGKNRVGIEVPNSAKAA